MIGIDELWSRVKSSEGEVFHQIRGGEFTYSIERDYLQLNRTNQAISKSDFKEALELVPLKDTTLVHHLRGPSYIYAILMDRRIRKDDW
ncbi:hypothetical protein ACFLQQ_03790 [Actinomycetota bacterium]